MSECCMGGERTYGKCHGCTNGRLFGVGLERPRQSTVDTAREQDRPEDNCSKSPTWEKIEHPTINKIEAIRKRHATKARMLELMGTRDLTHDDRGALLAMLDEEWRGEGIEDGTWWLSMHPDMRGKRPAVMPVVVQDGWVWLSTSEMPLGVNAPALTRALWQRHTVPDDPFAKKKAKR